MSTSKAQREVAERAREFLLTWLNPGDTVWTQVKHVARSGMMRVISVHVIRDGEIFDISRRVADAIGAPFDENRWGVKMNGAGMDMTFYIVYCLGNALWPHGVPCTGSSGYTPSGRKAKHPRCLSNDHSNGDRVYRRGKLHGDGGYALQRSHI